MAAGRPVICLDLGGPSTQVTEMTGFKIDTKDSSAIIPLMADAMKKLATDPYLRLHLGHAGRERVSKHFTWEEKAARLSTLYHQVALEGKVNQILTRSI
jgi:glycosyltransferase involved in cell wall biosynthesis